jgi:hypothetical protein
MGEACAVLQAPASVPDKNLGLPTVIRQVLDGGGPTPYNFIARFKFPML